MLSSTGWQYILEKHNGTLPLRIRAVPEGSVVPVKNGKNNQSSNQHCHFKSKIVINIIISSHPCQPMWPALPLGFSSWEPISKVWLRRKWGEIENKKRRGRGGEKVSFFSPPIPPHIFGLLLPIQNSEICFWVLKTPQKCLVHELHPCQLVHRASW